MGSRGPRIVPPLVPTTMPAIIGPMSSAAGSPISSNTVASTAETASRTPHCAGAESFSNRAGDWGSGAAGMAGLVPVGPFTVNPDRWSGRATGS
jgi:hypothetical protein